MILDGIAKLERADFAFGSRTNPSSKRTSDGAPVGGSAASITAQFARGRRRSTRLGRQPNCREKIMLTENENGASAHNTDAAHLREFELLLTKRIVSKSHRGVKRSPGENNLVALCRRKRKGTGHDIRRVKGKLIIVSRL